MVERSDGNLALALAAYNAGPGNASAWKRRFGTDDLDAFIERIPFGETRHYVARVLGNYGAYHSYWPD
jgi:soluble lytic murein transglycosylase